MKSLKNSSCGLLVLTMLIPTIFAVSPSVFAGSPDNVKGGELDDEQAVINQQAMRDLPPVVVVRVNEKTKAVEVANLDKPVKISEVAPALVSNAKFTAIEDGKIYAANELDRDNSRASWRFSYRGWRPGFGYGLSPFNYGYGWGVPSYSYGSYAFYYTPISSYFWGGYNYYYYGANFYSYFGWF